MGEQRERLPRPVAGAVIAYFDLGRFLGGSVRRAVAVGPEIVDPGTEEWWAPIRRPDRTIDLVPAALIIDVLPAARDRDC